jgi:Skp family chaperone for outer membrane proteins
MKLQSMPIAVVVLAAAAAWAQTSLPVVGPGMGRASSGRSGRMPTMLQSKLAAAQTPAAFRQRVAEMQETLTKMHAILKQMETKAASSGAKDPTAKSNLQMWQLMLGHLDNQLEQLRLASLQREELEARRAALYRQADEKAAAAASQAAAQHPAVSATNPPATQPVPQPPAAESASPK